MTMFKARTEEKGWLWALLLLFSGKWKFSQNPPPSKFVYFSQLPTLSQIAAKEPGRKSGHIVIPNKNGILFSRKERGMGFVLATNRVCHLVKWYWAEAAALQRRRQLCTLCLVLFPELPSVPLEKDTGPLSSAFQLHPNTIAAAKCAWPHWPSVFYFVLLLSTRVKNHGLCEA